MLTPKSRIVGFKYLVLGLPRWLPIPSLTKAHIARRRLLDAISSLQGALDHTAAGNEPNQPWRDLSDVGAILRKRNVIWNACKIMYLRRP